MVIHLKVGVILALGRRPGRHDGHLLHACSSTCHHMSDFDVPADRTFDIVSSGMLRATVSSDIPQTD